MINLREVPISLLDSTYEGLLHAALNERDYVAGLVIWDYLEDKGFDVLEGYNKGDKALFCSLTLYFIGEVHEVERGMIHLKKASWIHWTGQLSVLMKHKDFEHPELASRPPRIEYVGDVVLHTQGFICHYPGPWVLPTRSISG